MKCRQRAGEICCFRPKRVISEAFHLSFPLVFPFDGEYYLIPESNKDNSLLIYKMGASAYDWTSIRRIPMYDSKNLADDGGYQDELIQTVEAYEMEFDLPVGKYEIRGTHTYSRTSRYDTVDLFCNYYSVRNIFAKIICKFF